MFNADGAVDAAATEVERNRVRAARVTLPVQLATPAGAAALRGWVQLAEPDGEDSWGLRLGPLGVAALGANSGDIVELRALGTILS